MCFHVIGRLELVLVVNHCFPAAISESTEGWGGAGRPPAQWTCRHAAEGSAPRAELPVRLRQEVRADAGRVPRGTLQGLRQVRLRPGGRRRGDGVLLALRPPEWELLPDLHGEFHPGGGSPGLEGLGGDSCLLLKRRR